MTRKTKKEKKKERNKNKQIFGQCTGLLGNDIHPFLPSLGSLLRGLFWDCTVSPHSPQLWPPIAAYVQHVDG